MSLRTKLVLLVVLLTTTMLGGLGVAVGGALNRWATEVVDAELERRVEVLTNEVHVEHDGTLALDDDDDLATRGLPFRIEDEAGRLLAGSERWPATTKAGLGFETLETKKGEQLRVHSMAFTPRHGHHSVVLRVAAPLTSIDRLTGRFREGLVLALLLAAVLSTLGATVLAQWFVAPIRRLSNEANALEAQALSGRLATTGLDPALRQLAVAFNGLLDRVASVMLAQRDFVARASHALRTPLASLLTQAEVVLQHERSGEKYRTTLESIAQTTREASGLTDALLALARADASTVAGEKEDVLVTDLAASLQRLFRPRAEGLGLRFECDVPTGVRVKATRARLEEALDALIDNALRYTPRGGLVRFMARVAEDQRVVLEVNDDGPGIGADERAHVFTRFFRGAAAKNSGQPGSGLGLALVKALIEAEGGEVKLLDSAKVGTRVVISLAAR